MDAAWDAPPRRPSALDSAPMLSVKGFEGLLDWLLALVDTFGIALDQALREAEITPAVRARWGDWLVMAADLMVLRSRLLLTADAADGRAARDQAKALRRQLVRKAEMRAPADWLERQKQLGRDVFGRGQSGDTRTTKGGRTGGGDVTALLRACLAALRLPADAVARIRRLLPELGEDGGNSGPSCRPGSKTHPKTRPTGPCAAGRRWQARS